MTILAWIIVGIIAGIIANLIYPGRERGGLIGAMLLGIVGAIIGGWIFAAVTGFDFVNGVNLQSIVVSVVGALIVLIVYHAIFGMRSSAA